MMVTISPGLIVVGVQPARISVLTPPPPISILQSMLPDLYSSVKSMNAWGLTHRKLFTVPSIVTVFPASNIAIEWCAKASGTERLRTAAALRKCFMTVSRLQPLVLPKKKSATV